ncbi:TlyA family RNA methyltransferase [Alicyclobacillus tolerans]|uniref:TlyA family RNA methyltransferase n=1 Tax=Alicyclobacillus tolerans TaxID=90970 RepID=UPI001F3CA234|nr:TlyA family RNA methyltransferase [Alicyclobacillus tolerans]MCF8563605.1 TlyA family RNA methyltransferase [Alicyclobacillus tolerans]
MTAKGGPKVRLDTLLVARGLFPSREAARRAIMAGLVKQGTQVLDKPGTFVRETDVLDVAPSVQKFVGRGGFKLERAIEQFSLSLQDKVVVDVGASTGGFTDCALQHGAKSVFSVDVGYGQLAWKLRNDPRVVVMERTNFRTVDPSVFEPRPKLAVMDVSFISTRLLLPRLSEVLQGEKDVISLIKPQFEAGRDLVGKGGIVRDPKIHLKVIVDLLDFVYKQGWRCKGLDYSPISGGDGNLEYLAWWSLEDPLGKGDPLENERESTKAVPEDLNRRARNVVVAAWEALRGEQVADLL